MKLSAITLFFCITCFQLSAQKDTEFPKEFVLYAKLHNGMVTDFGKAPDLYAGGIQLVPQYTIVANAIRAGINCGVFYTGQRIQGAVGPVFSFKLKTIEASLFGSVANIHINIEHLWGTEENNGYLAEDLILKLEGD